MAGNNDISEIIERNARVEADKAWETSRTRKACIVLVTYLLATLLMWMSGVEKPWLGALVPSLGYFLSTLSLSALKNFWMRNIYRKP